MTLGIYCAGGLGREVLELARQVGGFETIVFVDDGNIATIINDVPVMSFLDFSTVYSPKDACLTLATGEPLLRQFLHKKVTVAGYRLTNLIHPTALLPTNCILGNGVLIMAYTIFTARAIIGDNVLIYPQSIIAHDAQVNSNCAIMSGVRLSGNTMIGSGTFVGAGVVVRDEITIGEHCIIGMGSMVLSNIPDHCLAYGNPARVIRTIKDNTLVF